MDDIVAAKKQSALGTEPRLDPQAHIADLEAKVRGLYPVN